MKIFPANILREIDTYTIENEPIESIDLMERAASRLLDWFVHNFKINRKVIILAGPGNNGGDALALARMLLQRMYRIEVFLLSPSGNLSQDCKKNLERLESTGIVIVKSVKVEGDIPTFESQDVVVDGLFGSGLTRVPEGLFRVLISRVNASESTVISIDIPSGLFGEDNSANDKYSIIKADYTLSFQFPFLSFFFSENEQFTGQWKILDIGLHKEIISKTESGYSMLSRKCVAALLPKRSKFSHKGTYGHALIIAGSRGMMGAAVLTGTAALRSGAGLVTVHAPGCGCDILQTAIPEVIVSLDAAELCFSLPPELKGYDAIVVGPGLGSNDESKKGLRKLLSNVSVPIVLDADALNIIANETDMEALIPAGSILTPHPGEFDRLVGKSPDGWSRHKKQIDFSVKNQVVIVLKGANTGISFPDGSYIFNPTGNPGMATGGSGDVLSGIIVSLLAQGMSPGNAAQAGVFLHGLAGDIAEAKIGQQALIAGDIINNLGEAFMKVTATQYLNEDRTWGVVQ